MYRGSKLQLFFKRFHLERTDWRAWAMYDWAHSSFATTILTAVLPVFYASYAAQSLSKPWRVAAWSYTATIGILIIAFLSPIIGVLADKLNIRKKLMIFFGVVGAVGSACLFFIPLNGWKTASVIFIIAEIGYALSLVCANSFLPFLTKNEKEADVLSTSAWALGYAGGGLLLLIHLIMIAKPAWFGMSGVVMATKVVFVTVGVWWLVFMIPAILYLPEPEQDQPIEPFGFGTIFQIFKSLWQTFKEVKKYPELHWFLIAYWLYSDGIGTVMKMATIYGYELGIEPNHLVGAILMVQFVGIFSTLLLGKLSKQIGTRTCIYIALVIYMFVSIFGYFTTKTWHFWLLAFMVALAQGGALSLSRSLFSTLVPKGKEGELFGFFSLSERFAGSFGPLLFGIVSERTGSSRLSILMIILFFIFGLIILSRVDIERGRSRANGVV